HTPRRVSTPTFALPTPPPATSSTATWSGSRSSRAASRLKHLDVEVFFRIGLYIRRQRIHARQERAELVVHARIVQQLAHRSVAVLDLPDYRIQSRRGLLKLGRHRLEVARRRRNVVHGCVQRR